MRCSRISAGRSIAPSPTTEALEAFRTLSQVEGIIPALESAHAVHAGMERAKAMAQDETVVITISGRGDKDLETVYALGMI